MTHLAAGDLNLIKRDFKPEDYCRPGTLWKLSNKYGMFYHSSQLLKIIIWRSLRGGSYTVSVHLAGRLPEHEVLKALLPAQVILAFVEKPRRDIHPTKWVARVQDTSQCYQLLKRVSVFLSEDNTIEIQKILEAMKRRYGIVETNARL